MGGVAFKTLCSVEAFYLLLQKCDVIQPLLYPFSSPVDINTEKPCSQKHVGGNRNCYGIVTQFLELLLSYMPKMVPLSVISFLN